MKRHCLRFAALPLLTITIILSAVDTEARLRNDVFENYKKPATNQSGVMVNGNSGSFQYKVPLDLPPAPGGFGPELSLSYNSQGENGPLGKGWAIPVPSIRRRVGHGGLNYSGVDDFIYSDGAGTVRLAKLGSNTDFPDATEYRLEFDDGRALRFFLRAAADSLRSSWFMLDKDEVTSYFGESTSAQISDGATGVSRRVYEWNLSRRVDVFNNEIRYWYAGQVPATSETSYLTRITYGSASVQFEYSNGNEALVRRDAVVSHLTGFPVRTTRYLKSVTTYFEAIQARKYAIQYRINELTDNLLLVSVQQIGRLGGVLPAMEFTYSGEEVEAIPFSPPPSSGAMNRPSTPKEIENLTDDVVYPSGSPLQTMTGLAEPWFSADFNGDGCRDIMHLVSNTAVRIWLGQPDGKFEVQPEWTSPRSMQGAMNSPEDGSGIYQYVFQFGDFNGDNAADVFFVYDNNVGYIWFAQFDAAGHFSGFNAVQMIVPRLDLYPYSTQSFTYEMPDDPRSWAGYRVRYRFVVGDYNGDGRDDLLSFYPQCPTGGDVVSAPGRYFVLYSMGDGSFAKQELVAPSLGGKPYDFGLPLMANDSTYGNCIDPSTAGDGRADYTILACDLNGDGLTDLVHPRCREAVDVFLCQGPGAGTAYQTSFVRLTLKTEHSNHWWGSQSSAPNDFRISAGDFNGDGVLDLAHELYPMTEDADLCILFGSNDWRTGFDQFLGDGDPVTWTGFGYHHIDAGESPLGNQPHIWFQFTDFDGNGRTDIADIVPWDTTYYIDVVIRRDCFQFVGRGDGTFYHTHYMSGPLVLCPQILDSCDPPQWYRVADRSDCDMPVCVFDIHPSGEFPGILGGGVLRVDDFNGDGMGDFLNLDSTTFANYHTDLQNSHPDLLTEIRDGGHVLASVGYRQSAYADNARMGMSIPVVASVEQYDGLSDTVSQYASAYTFENGSYDRVRREFGGFGVVEELNESGVRVVSEYHQEPALRGRLARSVTIAENADTLSIRREYWRAVAAGPSLYASLDSSVVYTRDIGDAGGADLIQKLTYTYDPQHYGVTAEVLSGTGMVDGVYYVSGPGEASSRETTYQKYGKWRWKQTSRTVSGALTGISRHTIYVNHPTTGSTIAVLDGYGGGQSLVTSFLYDNFGNVFQSHMDGGTTTDLQYDPSGAMVVSKRVSDGFGLSLRDSMVVDRGLGIVTDTWTPNGELIHVNFDEFGRTVAVTQFEGTPAAPGVYDSGLSADKLMQYFDSEMPRRIEIRERLSARGQPDDYSVTTEYYSLDGVLLQSTTKVSPDTQGGARYSSVSNFNVPAGRINWIMGPYFSTDSQYKSWVALPDSVKMTETHYDGLGRPHTIKKSTRSHGAIETILNHGGNGVEILNPALVPVRYIWDAAGRVRSATTRNADWSDWCSTLHTHNTAGDVLTSRSGWTYDFDESSWHYDRLGRATFADGPDVGPFSFLWHSTGHLMRVIEPDGETRLDYRDSLGRAIQTRYSRSGALDVRNYDNPNVDNALGLPTGIDGAGYHWDARSYDSRGRCVSDSVSIAGIYSARAQYLYRTAGELDELQYPGGGSAAYSYYPGTRTLSGIEAQANGASLRIVYGDCVPTGRARRVEYFNGAEAEPFLRMDLDIGSADERLYRATAVARPMTAAPDTVMDKRYSYRIDGNIEAIRDRVKGKQLGMAGAFVVRYDYDFADRLIKEFDNGAANANRQYTYESAHARMKTQKSGSRTMTYAYDAARAHRVATLTVGQNSFPFTYDTRGHVTSDVHLEQFTQVTPRAMSYDDRGQLQQVAIEGQMGLPDILENYTYSPDGEMILQTDATGSVTVRPYSFYEVVNDSELRYVVSSDGIEGYIRSDEGVSYVAVLVKDRRGNVCAVVNGDGSVSVRTEYTSWGQVATGVDQDISERHLESQKYHFMPKLHDFGPRKYDSSYALFLGPDALSPNETDPLAANRYAYARYNPLRYIDPTGREYEAVDPDWYSWAQDHPKEAVGSMAIGGAGAVVVGGAIVAAPEIIAVAGAAFTAGGQQIAARLGPLGMGVVNWVQRAWLGDASSSSRSQALNTTAHGAERIAGPAATRGGVLYASEVPAVREGGRVARQADGAIVHVLEVTKGRFRVVIENEQTGKIITTFRDISQKALDRLERRHGWKW